MEKEPPKWPSRLTCSRCYYLSDKRTFCDGRKVNADDGEGRYVYECPECQWSEESEVFYR